VRIVVPLKQVPDLVEELELSSDGTDVDREFLKFVVNEFDDHALEEALLVKEASGGEVVVVGFDEPDIDQALYTAIAKGADRAVKLTGAGPGAIDSHTRAAALAEWLAGQDADLVLTGVQAPDDLDGQLAPLLAARMGLPHASVVVSVDAKDGVARVRQEFSGGAGADLEIRLPAVIGVQAARQPPRYASITRVRQVMQAGGIEEAATSAAPGGSALTVRRLYPPEQSGHAEMLDGSPAEVAERIIELVRAKGLIKT
jgi:electron transfer flavoprotein beta subunit